MLDCWFKHAAAAITQIINELITPNGRDGCRTHSKYIIWIRGRILNQFHHARWKWLNNTVADRIARAWIKLRKQIQNHSCTEIRAARCASHDSLNSKHGRRYPKGWPKFLCCKNCRYCFFLTTHCKKHNGAIYGATHKWSALVFFIWKQNSQARFDVRPTIKCFLISAKCQMTLS